MMLNTLRLVFRRINFANTSLYYHHVDGTWVSNNAGDAFKIETKDVKRNIIWHNTWLLCPPSIASDVPNDTNNDLLSLTKIKDKTIYDYGPNPACDMTEQLPFYPQGIVGTVGLAVLAMQNIKSHPDCFVIMLLKDRVILCQFVKNNLKKARTIKLRQTNSTASLLSTFIPKLIQAGIQFGQSKCQLIYTKNSFSEETIQAVTQPLKLNSTDITCIPSYAQFVMKAWWSASDLPKPITHNLSFPKLGITLLICLSVILAGLTWLDNTLPQPVAAPEEAVVVNNEIIGALNDLGINAKLGPVANLKALQEIPDDSWITRFEWKAKPQVFIEGYSIKQVNAYRIQDSMSHLMDINIKELKLGFINNNNKASRWTLGSRIN